MYQDDGKTSKSGAGEAGSFSARIGRAAKGDAGKRDPNGKRDSGDHAIDGASGFLRGEGGGC